MPIRVDPEKCDGCGVCIRSCPMDALRMKNNKPYLRYDECWYCGACMEDCPRQALTLELPYQIS
ncbi:4Fe-4S ferredoxin [Candidatus Bathyarchaeota archaeon]|nr:MAG: 4Fe-4S ferredoxin [Candidatus Bathyarchaeota archaeon]